ncbi:MAG: 2,3-diphosphoglycerate-dependent phosphoglycerate mutase [Candidatus Nanoarchaeia archaeon]
MRKRYTLVLLRHGESAWNKQNRFTGWTDVGLTEKGRREAKSAGRLLKTNRYSFDIAFTSYLKKAYTTLNIAKRELKQKISTIRAWQLNERHYGALQGLNKSRTAKAFGEKQVLLWRRSYSTRPPMLTRSDVRWPGNDPLYAGVPKKYLPLGESLKDTVGRVIPYWKKVIVPEIRSGKKVLITAHGNSLRALVKHLDRISAKDILGLNIPTGVPLVYILDEKMKPIRKFYLGDKRKIKKAMQEVAKQGKAHR